MLYIDFLHNLSSGSMSMILLTITLKLRMILTITLNLRSATKKSGKVVLIEPDLD